MAKTFTYFLRVILTFGFIWYFISKIDISTSLGVLRTTHIGFFGLSLVVVGITWLISALRWQWILRAVELKVSVARLFLFNMIGNFYGIVLPGGKLAGDIMCAYRFTKDRNDPVQARRYFLSVFADRYLGALTMLIILASYFARRHGVIYVFGEYTWLIGGISIFGAAFGIIMFFSNVLDFFFKLLGKIPFKFTRSVSETLVSALRVTREHPKEFGIAFVISLCAIFCNLGAMYVVGLSVGINLGFWEIGFAFLAATLLITIPVTVAGIGLREGGIVYILTQAGAALPQAAALSILALTQLILYAAVGGIAELYFLFKRKNDHSSVPKIETE